jgi:hypothetical protein
VQNTIDNVPEKELALSYFWISLLDWKQDETRVAAGCCGCTPLSLLCEGRKDHVRAAGNNDFEPSTKLSTDCLFTTLGTLQQQTMLIHALQGDTGVDSRMS